MLAPPPPPALCVGVPLIEEVAPIPPPPLPVFPGTKLLGFPGLPALIAPPPPPPCLGP